MGIFYLETGVTFTDQLQYVLMPTARSSKQYCMQERAKAIDYLRILENCL